MFNHAGEVPKVHYYLSSLLNNRFFNSKYKTLDFLQCTYEAKSFFFITMFYLTSCVAMNVWIYVCRVKSCIPILRDFHVSNRLETLCTYIFPMTLKNSIKPPPLTSEYPQPLDFSYSLKTQTIYGYP